ncbi:MAG TPA: NAD(P)/FAD-dependent oxidoreductase [Cytophagaceae bacterium]
MTIEKVDVLVIGAGPSGTVAASMVRQKGYNVKIVEKLKFPRFVIGESLLPRCMEALSEAGFIEAIKAKGFQEKFGAKFVRKGKICDFNFSSQFTEGWNWTWQVPREEFDKTLADTVQAMGVPIEYETEVKDIKFEGTDSSTTVVDISGNTKVIQAKFIVDASGYGRVIPRLFNLDKPSNLPPRKTLFAHIKDSRRLNYEEPNRITIIDHAPGVWAWVIPFSNGNTSVGFVGEPKFFENFSGTVEQKYRSILASEPYIAERFSDSELVFEPRTIEGWSMSTEKFYGDGYVLTGNVTEFLDPIFSSGVTLATVSACTAGKLVARQLQGEIIDWEKEFMEPTMQGVNAFRSYVMSWYNGKLQEIFFADKPLLEIKNQICSVLAGYVWDQKNPYVKRHDRAIDALVGVIQMEASHVKEL